LDATLSFRVLEALNDRSHNSRVPFHQSILLAFVFAARVEFCDVAAVVDRVRGLCRKVLTAEADPERLDANPLSRAQVGQTHARPGYLYHLFASIEQYRLRAVVGLILSEHRLVNYSFFARVALLKQIDQIRIQILLELWIVERRLAGYRFLCLSV